MLTACSLTASPAAAPTPEAAKPAATAAPAAKAPSAEKVSAARSSWQESAHNNTYDLGKGPNTYCSRCHSPQNWDPAAKPGRAPNCISCKFPFDKEVRRAPENPLIEEANWKPIGCETCHTDVGPFRYGVDMGKGAHSAMTCTTCHDAHATTASCLSAGCHAGVDKAATAGHDAAHAAVRCVACHDGSGMKVGPAIIDGQKTWATFKTGSVGGKAGERAFASHNLQRTVACSRCHFAGNTWGLSTK